MGLNVLIVDDSPLARKIVRRAVDMTGVGVGELYEAGDGREALALLDEHWIDVVFADINMPGMNGMEMIEQMAAQELLGTVPVVVVSTERSQARIEFLASLGVRSYLTKPLTPEAVRDALNDVLGLRGGTDGD